MVSFSLFKACSSRIPNGSSHSAQTDSTSGLISHRLQSNIHNIYCNVKKISHVRQFTLNVTLLFFSLTFFFFNNIYYNILSTFKSTQP